MEGDLVACFILRVVGTHQYLSFLSGGRNYSSLVYVPVGGGQTAREFLSVSAVFRPMCVAEKRCVGRKCAGHHQNSWWCGPDLTRSGRRIREVPNSGCGDVSRDLSIGAEPDGCDVARIKLHYGKSNPDGKWRAGLSGRLRARKSRVSPHRILPRCLTRCVTLRD